MPQTMSLKVSSVRPEDDKTENEKKTLPALYKPEETQHLNHQPDSLAVSVTSWVF